MNREEKVKKERRAQVEDSSLTKRMEEAGGSFIISLNKSPTFKVCLFGTGGTAVIT